MSESIYNQRALTIKGEDVALEKYKGKNILIVNTASNCGFTPQYQELQALYKRNENRLAILAFPCNQFGAQEPGDEAQIQSFCDLNFNITFELFKKVEVNGDNAHPLFSYIKNQLPGVLGSKAIKWNFTKFLFGPDGTPIKRYAPKTSPQKIEQDLI